MQLNMVIEEKSGAVILTHIIAYEVVNTGNVVEELLEERSLVCLNNSKGTRLNIY